VFGDAMTSGDTFSKKEALRKGQSLFLFEPEEYSLPFPPTTIQPGASYRLVACPAETMILSGILAVSGLAIVYDQIAIGITAQLVNAVTAGQLNEWLRERPGVVFGTVQGNEHITLDVRNPTDKPLELRAAAIGRAIRGA
jgi:hypothetical protein